MPGSIDPESDRPDPMVRVENVSFFYGNQPAVDQASLSVNPGRICGIVGSDGAGKTTLLRMIATMIAPARGRIRIDGKDVVRDRNAVKAAIGYMPQRFGLYLDLTVDENLDFFMDLFGISGPERAQRRQRYLGFSNLLPFTERLAGDLSGGMKQKLGLACVLVHQPKVLILDEPTNGVDPVSRREFWQILAEMRAGGMAILVSTAYLDEGEKCDWLALMHDGRVLVQDRPEVIRAGHASLEEAMIARIAHLIGDKASDDGF